MLSIDILSYKRECNFTFPFIERLKVDDKKGESQLSYDNWLSRALVARHPIEQPAANSKKKNYSSSFLTGVRSNVVTGVNFSSSGSI